MPETKLFAVAGKPVLHSLSPEIFRRLFRAAGLNAVYFRLAAENGREVMETARAMGLAGANITSPFKEEVLPYLDDADGPQPDHRRRQRDRRAPGGRILGLRNGSGAGVIGALRSRIRRLPAGRRAVVLGAGGAARAAAYGLLRRPGPPRCLGQQDASRGTGPAARRLRLRPLFMGGSGAGASGMRYLRLVRPRELGFRGLSPPSEERLVFLAAAYTDVPSLPGGASRRGARCASDGREWLLPSGPFPLSAGSPGRRFRLRFGTGRRLERTGTRDRRRPRQTSPLWAFRGRGKPRSAGCWRKRSGATSSIRTTLSRGRTGIRVAGYLPEARRIRLSGARKGRHPRTRSPEAGRTVYADRRRAGWAGPTTAPSSKGIASWSGSGRRSVPPSGAWAPGSRPLLEGRGEVEGGRLCSPPGCRFTPRASDIAIVGERKPAGRIAGRIKNEIDQAFAD